MTEVVEIYRKMLLAAGVSEAMLKTIEGETTSNQQQYVLFLTPYEAANLMQAVRLIYAPKVEDRDDPARDQPIYRLNTGDWIGQLHWKLREEVGDDYPVPPNPIYIPPEAP